MLYGGITMNVSDPLHYSGEPRVKRGGDDVSGTFADVLNNAVKKVNDLQVDAQDQVQHRITSYNVCYTEVLR